MILLALMNGNLVCFVQLRATPFSGSTSVMAFAKCQLGKKVNTSLSVRDLKLFKAVTKIYIQIGAKKMGLKYFFFPTLEKDIYLYYYRNNT